MPREELNIHEKLLKIANIAGILQKTKEGFNYNYVPEEEIQAKITAGMQKYGVMLYDSINPGTLTVTPIHYEKMKTEKTYKDGKSVSVKTMIPVNEVIVTCDVTYTWVNVDNPEERVVCGWAYVGQMEDASQAFGSGATYGNRYFLLKALQLATSEADPDEYRSKQRKAEADEEKMIEEVEKEKLSNAIKTVVEVGTKLISLGVSKTTIAETVGKHNNGEKNPACITDAETCEAILKDFDELFKKHEQKKSENKINDEGAKE